MGISKFLLRLWALLTLVSLAIDGLYLDRRA